MKAVLSPRSGPPEVLQYTEINKPQPKPHEILIKVNYASVTSGDVKLRKFIFSTNFSIEDRFRDVLKICTS